MKKIDYIIILGLIFILAGSICLSGTNEFNGSIVWVGIAELVLGICISIVGIIKK